MSDSLGIWKTMSDTELQLLDFAVAFSCRFSAEINSKISFALAQEFIREYVNHHFVNTEELKKSCEDSLIVKHE